MDDDVRDYIDAIAPEHRPLFDRLHRLVLEARPDATVVLSYQIPTYHPFPGSTLITTLPTFRPVSTYR
jgi:hypothetical protein